MLIYHQTKFDCKGLISWNNTDLVIPESPPPPQVCYGGYNETQGTSEMRRTLPFMSRAKSSGFLYGRNARRCITRSLKTKHNQDYGVLHVKPMMHTQLALHCTMLFELIYLGGFSIINNCTENSKTKLKVVTSCASGLWVMTGWLGGQVKHKVMTQKYAMLTSKSS